jgi:hypothetical protein
MAVLTTTVLQAAAQSERNTPAQPPSKLIVTECEGINKCSPWTFYSSEKKSFAKWSTGEEASLEIVSWSNDQIKIKRFDTHGDRPHHDIHRNIDPKGAGGTSRSSFCQTKWPAIRWR